MLNLSSHDLGEGYWQPCYFYIHRSTQSKIIYYVATLGHKVAMCIEITCLPVSHPQLLHTLGPAVVTCMLFSVCFCYHWLFTGFPPIIYTCNNNDTCVDTAYCYTHLLSMPTVSTGYSQLVCFFRVLFSNHVNSWQMNGCQ